MILTPYGKIPGAWPSGITQSRNGNGAFVNDDPQFNTRGEAGYYYDTPLGASRLNWWQRMKLKRGYRQLSIDRMKAEASSPFLVRSQTIATSLARRVITCLS